MPAAKKKSRRNQGGKQCGYIWFGIISLCLIFPLLCKIPVPYFNASNGSNIITKALSDQERKQYCRSVFSELDVNGLPRKQYSVVFDIGSTGSRAHGFRLNRRPNCSSTVSCLEAEHELFVENDNPLSEIVDPIQCVKSLDPLYDAVLDYIPKELHSCTQVQFMATAGLRKLGKEKADRILSTVEHHFTQRGNLWLRGSQYCRILEGSEEGPLAWITVNFLLGNFVHFNDASAAILDLGGGSAQIVFEPPPNLYVHVPSAFRFERQLDRRKVNAYQHSYNLGLHEGVRLLLHEVSERSSTFHTSTNYQRLFLKDHFPCFPSGYMDRTSGVRNVEKGGKAAANFSACVDLFDTVLLHPPGTKCTSGSCGIADTYQPSLESFTGPFYAYSFIHELFSPSLPPDSNVMTPRKMAEIGESVCNSLTLEQANRGERRGASLIPAFDCLYFSFVYALLTKGYGIPDTRELHIAKKLHGFETAWALGSGLVALDE